MKNFFNKTTSQLSLWMQIIIILACSLLLANQMSAFSGSGVSINPQIITDVISPNYGEKIKNGPQDGFTAKVEVQRNGYEIGQVKFLVLSNDYSFDFNVDSDDLENNAENISYATLESGDSDTAIYGKYFRTEYWTTGEKILVALIYDNFGTCVSMDITGPIFTIHDKDEDLTPKYPDLVIKNTEIVSEKEEEHYETFYAKVQIENIGKASSGEFKIRWYYDVKNSAEFFTQDVPNIDIEENIWVTMDSHRYKKGDVYPVVFVLDKLNRVEEEKNDNNEKAETIRIEAELPDLEIRNLKKAKFDKYGFSFDICFHGSRSIDDLTEVYPEYENIVNGKIVIDENGIEQLEESWISDYLEEYKDGECGTTSIWLHDNQKDIFDKTGKVKIQLDSKNIMEESDEINNEAEIFVPLWERNLPDLVVQNIRFQKNWNNFTNVITAEVWNLSDQTTTLEKDLSMMISLNGKSIYTHHALPQNKLDPNEHFNAFWVIDGDNDFNNITSGVHQVYVVVDRGSYNNNDDNQINESDENNNYEYQNIYINLEDFERKGTCAGKGGISENNIYYEIDDEQTYTKSECLEKYQSWLAHNFNFSCGYASNGNPAIIYRNVTWKTDSEMVILQSNQCEKLPDLQIEDINFLGKNDGRLSAKVCNYGEALYDESPNFLPVRFGLDGQKTMVPNLSIQELDVNKCEKVYIPISKLWIYDTGNYNFTVEVGTNYQEESNQQNNKFSKNLYLDLDEEIKLPDLIISDIYIDPNQPIENEAFQIVFYIKNQGQGRALPRHFGAQKLFLSYTFENKKYEIKLPFFDPGQEKKVIDYITASSDGIKKLTAIVNNKSFGIEEFDKTNNTYYKNIEVQKSTLNCIAIWEGYKYNSIQKKCIKSSAVGCDNPFKYNSYSACMNDNTEPCVKKNWTGYSYNLVQNKCVQKTIFACEKPTFYNSLDSCINTNKQKYGSNKNNEDYEDVVRTNYFFLDTDPNSLEGIAAAYLREKNIIGGRPSGEFDGEAYVNRAEAAKFLLLGAEHEVEDLKNLGYFSDVIDGEWYTKYVMTAEKLDIIEGYDFGVYRLFKPGQNVNTVEFLKMITLSFDLEENLDHYYEDVYPSDWFNKYAGIAQKYDLFPHREDNILEPGKELTRNEVAVAIYKILIYQDTH